MGEIVSQKQKTYDPGFEKGTFKKGYGEENSGEVMTIQNDAYTIRELLEKFVSGVFKPSMLMRSGMQEFEYEDGIEKSTVSRFIDRTEVQEFIDSVESVKKRAVSKAKAAQKATQATTGVGAEGAKGAAGEAAAQDKRV